MSDHTLHFSLPDPERPSIWPWVIVLLCGACLLVLLARAVQSIPIALQQQAQQHLSTTGLDSAITVIANGRDLELQGSIDKDLSTIQLIEQLSMIDGVRIVRDNLTRFDPVENDVKRTQDFLQTLARIDTASVSFRPGSNSVSIGSEQALQQVAQLLNAHPNKRIRIEGHTDNTGPASVNMRLSQERAEAVARFLTRFNVSSKQLIAKGYGATQPIHDNATESGRARNRRIEISYVD